MTDEHISGDMNLFQKDIAAALEKHHIDIESFVEQKFDWMQLNEISKGLEAGVDVTIYARQDYFFLQMEQIRVGLEHGIDVTSYAKPEYSHLIMREMRKALEENISLERYLADITDGKILREIRLGILHQVDLYPYAREGYDSEQLSAIRSALENKIDIKPYLSLEFYGTQIHEIMLGIQDEVDVAQYATGQYNWQQMEQIRLGLEEHLDISSYKSPLMNWQQMEQVRLGLVDELDVSSYSSLMLTADEMSKRRKELMAQKEKEMSAEKCEKTLEDLDALTDNMGETDLDIVPIHLKISADKMQVMMELFPPDRGETHKIKTILDILRENGIVQGIDNDVIEHMIKDRIYYQPRCVARGRERVQGENGYFEYLFRTEMPIRPKKRKDGSLDYYEMDLYEPVHRGDTLVIYHPATAGRYGFDVYGRLLVPQKGAELPPLRGEGFLLSEDRKTYTAALDGKVSLENNSFLKVARVFVVKGNQDYAVGNIYFDGDVSVYGDVLTGFSIHASGNVQINGHVENAKIVSGGNVVVRQGMNGYGGGMIQAEGEVHGAYFEEAVIRAKGKVSANYILNSDIITDDKVTVSGGKSVIIGGSISALHGIEAFTVGNSSQATTKLAIGVNDLLMEQRQNIAIRRIKIKEQLEILSNGQRQLVGKDARLTPKAMKIYQKIQQALAMKRDELRACDEEKEHIDELIQGAARSKVIVQGVAHAGLVIRVDRREMRLRENVRNVYFTLLDDHVAMIRLR